MANRWFLRVAVLLIPALALLPQPISVTHAQKAAAGSCLGKVKVSPNPVKVGAWFTVTGSGFSCKDMANKVYPLVGVIIFQPKLGFVIYNPHVSHGGYTVHVHFPAKLTNLGAIDGQPTKSVVTRPGQYYVDIRLSDVSVAVADAQAKFQVSK